MSNKEKLIASAQKNLQKGQIAKAIKDYSQVVQLDPRDIRNRQKLAELFCRAGMNSEALGEYGAVAKYYADGGFYLKAIAVYKQMQKVDPEQLSIYHRLAELHVKQGLIGNALAEYRNLLAYFEKKRLLTDAIAILQKMVELEPENLKFHVKITEYYAQAGLREKARAEFEQILGNLRENRDFSRMTNLYEMLGPLFSDPEIKSGYAEALICKGEIEKGLVLLKNLLREHSDNRQILLALTFGYREKKDFENERLTFQHLLKQSPGDLDLREGYIRACLDGGEFHRALEDLDEWREAFFDAGKVAVIKGFYESLLKSFPTNDSAQEALALISERAGGTAKSFPAEPSVDPEAPGRDLSRNVDDEIPRTESDRAAVVLPPPAPESEPALNIGGADEETSAAEEIPLEFLQLSVESTRLSLAESPSGEDSNPAKAEVEQVVVAEEMEFELELDLEDPSALLSQDASGKTENGDKVVGIPLSEEESSDVSLAFAGSPDDFAEHAATLEIETGLSPKRLEELDKPEEILEELEPEEILEELEPEEILEELEPEEILEELEPEEILEELEPEEILEELEPAAAFLHPPQGCGAGVPAAQESFGQGLGDLLSGDENHPKGKNVRNILEEIDFYLHQELFDDAERVCRQILHVDPNRVEIKEKLLELAKIRQEVSDAPDEFQLFGLSGGIDAGDFDSRMSREEDAVRLDSFSGASNGIESQIDLEDTESHYNLGIAYKEMGLLDDALAEFDQAMRNPARLVDSLTLKGSCLLEKGKFAEAEEVFRDGLRYPQLSAGERGSLFYELGLLFEVWGRPLEALDCFQSSAEIDLFFRNVGEKVEALRKTLGMDSSISRDISGAKGDKSRVSYV